MFRESFLPRNFFLYLLCLPVALLLGYLLATPFAFTSYALVGLVLLGLALPLLLRWHHAALICFWNASLIVFFLPGQPALGITLGGISLLLSWLRRATRNQNTFIHVRSVAWSLVFIGVVAAVTAKVTGGIGGRALGTETWGARRYLGIIGAIVGYFALVAETVPKGKGMRYASLFILSGVTAGMSDLIYLAGPKFYLLYTVFSSEAAVGQALSQDTLLRFAGLGFAAQSASYFMLLRYGIRGVFDLRKPWRATLFLGMSVVSLLGGFRSTLIIGLMVFLCQFYMENLFKGRSLVALVVVVTVLASGLVAFADKLPLSMQRSLAFLPLDLDSTAKRDALGTLDWRIEMWKVVVPDIPKYLLVGKGFAYSGTDYYLTNEAMRRGLFHSYEDTLVSGNYHQGLLTLIIPFGIWGVIGFTWFCWAAIWTLYRNYRYGEEALGQINTFLLAFFVARLIFYIVFYGQFDLDMPMFAGLVGLSISLNGGVKAADAPEVANQALAR